ncbi:MAG: YicC family protein, partial [Clostridia bacterium]|nr:YicC family protein [Clostridia bacterium]
VNMAIYSMTGYGKGVAEKDGLKITVELKSVNHRFLDLNIKLPKTFAFAEDALRKIIQANVGRGHVDVYVNFEDGRKDKFNIAVDYDLARQYILIAKELKDKFGVENNLGANEIIRIPDVVSQVADESDEETLLSLIKQSCILAIDNLNAMRAVEGKALVDDLLNKVDGISGVLPEIQTLAPIALDEYRTKLRDRVQEYLKETPIDEVKLINEIAFYSDKVCTDEEITRLYTHIAHFRSIVKEGGAVGKKLDFIVQEMNRETNTIGSKCNYAQITERVVYLKSEIEKIREQVQNLV